MVTLLGIVADISVHGPNERRHDACKNRDKHLRREHEPESGLRDRDEKEEHREDAEGYVDGDEGGFLTKACSQRHAEGNPNHVAYFADSEEQAGVKCQLKVES